MAFVKNWRAPKPKPAYQDCLILSLVGASWAFSNILRIRSWDEKAVIVRWFDTASAANLLLSSWALTALWKNFVGVETQDYKRLGCYYHNCKPPRNDQTRHEGNSYTRAGL
ncbi:hypothetical protein CDL15_Pgr005792 [Punica granatum]|uniref:Uncharacterized protein n=1 Tax=Punica granatum TaxID=22663 RepID=A0A218WFM0_PUNGR|nr:hypothetical protein CDL15_Pgr005792 [Punica granatum]